MAYSADSFVADEQPTTAKWNKLWTNDASFNDGTGIAAGAITPEKLLSGAGTSWPWQPWTPAWTASSANPAIGNGTITGKYCRVGKIVVWKLYIVAGSTTTYGTGSYRFTYPVTPVTPTSTEDLQPIGFFNATRQGLFNATGQVIQRGSINTYFECAFHDKSNATYPFTLISSFGSTSAAWGSGDVFRMGGFYEAA